MNKNINKENNTISVQDLVAKYKSLNSATAKDNYLKSVIKIKPYVGYAEKLVYINNVLKNSCYDANGNLHIDSAKRYILYIQALLMAYTNIGIDLTQPIQDYDRLESNGLLEIILEAIPENELQVFDTMLKMKQDDLMTNYYDIHGYLDKKLKDFYPHIGGAVSGFLEKAGKFLEQLDEKKLEQILKKIMK